MKYYLIYFKNGFVIDVCSWDDFDSWEYQYKQDIANLESPQQYINLKFDQVQRLATL